MAVIEPAEQRYWHLFDQAAGLESPAPAQDAGQIVGAADILADMVLMPRSWRQQLALLQNMDVWMDHSDTPGLNLPEASVLGLLLIGQAFEPAIVPAAAGLWYRSAILLEGLGRNSFCLGKYAIRVLSEAMRSSTDINTRFTLLVEVELAFEGAVIKLLLDDMRVGLNIRATHADIMAGAFESALADLASDQALLLMGSAWLATGQSEMLRMGITAALGSTQSRARDVEAIPWAIWFRRAHLRESGAGFPQINELARKAMEQRQPGYERAEIAQSMVEMLLSSAPESSQ